MEATGGIKRHLQIVTCLGALVVKMITMIMVTGGNDNDDAMVICKLSRVLVERGDGDNDDNDYDDDNGCPAHSHLSCHASAENFPT